MAIKMIVSDLDGTLLNRHEAITEYTRKTIEKVMESGIHFVVATGRAMGTLPKAIREIHGIEYAITSNGAVITNLNKNEVIATSFIDEEATYEVERILSDLDMMVEIFVRGQAYIEKRIFDNIEKQGLSESGIDYVLRTRTPKGGLLDVFKEHRNEIENINVCFFDEEQKIRTRELFEKLGTVSVTSSMSYNIEIIGKNTDKAHAVAKLMQMHDIKPEELMAFGDNHNDIGMIKLAKYGIAMQNAEEALKKEASYVTELNTSDGVAKAIRKFTGIN